MVYKVQIIYRDSGKPINDKLYNELGAKIWIGRIAKSLGVRETELDITEEKEYERVWGHNGT